jgi:tetratricopeptide (TPR) repeat protein
MADMAQQCLKLARATWGEENLSVALALHQTGFAYRDLGDYVKAEAAGREALSLRRKLLGNENPLVADSLNALGNTLLAQGKLKDAEMLHSEALELRQKLSGKEDQDTAESLSNVASVLERQGRLAEAETKYREALAMLRRLNAEHPLVASAYVNLAAVLREEGKLTDAEATSREGLDLMRKLYGSEHPMVAISLNELGLVLQDQNKRGEAETVLRESLAVSKKFLGEEHPEVANSLNNLGIVLKDQGKLAEAESLTRQALAMRRKAFGNEHRNVADSLDNLGLLLLDEALTMRRKLLGTEHPDLGTSLNNLATVLLGQNKPAEAERALRESQAILKRWLGDKHPRVAASFNNLAVILQQQGKLPEAVAALREALAIQRAGSLNGKPDPASLDDLAWLLREQGNLAEAEVCLREALELVRPTGNDALKETSVFGVISHHLAELLRLKRAHPEARSLAQKSVAAYARHPQWASHEKQHALMVLATVLSDMGDSAGLEALYKEQAEVVVLDALATVLRDQAKLAEAEARLREGLKLARAEAGDPSQETPNYGLMSHHLAEVLRREKSFLEARSTAQESVAAYRRHPQWPLNEAQHAARVLEAVLNDMGDYAGVETLYRNHLQDLRASLPSDDPNLAAAAAQLVLALLTGHKFNEAEPLARECLEIREKQLPDDWRTFNTRSLLGESLMGQKKFEQAEPLLLSGYEGIKQREAAIPEVGKVRLKEAIRRLVQLYEETGRPAQAAEWKKKSEDFEQSQGQK